MKSSSIAFLLALVVLACFGSVAHAADPDPLQDFCVADINSTLELNGFPCKPSASIVVEDFTSEAFRAGQTAVAADSINVIPLFVQQLAGLNTAGLSIIRADLGPGGVNPPHIHPRSNELNLVLQGQVEVGFVDGNNKLFIKVLSKGDVFIIPRGVVHFQRNVGDSPASFHSIFNSQNPGVQRLPTTLFGTGIPSAVLQKSFQLSASAVAYLTQKLKPSS